MPGQPRNLHHYIINKADMITADVELRAGIYQEIGRRVVGAGEALGPGFGRDRGAEATHGRIYLDLRDDANAPIHGDVRIRLLRPDDTEIAVVWEDRTEDLAQGADARLERVAFPFSGRVVTENYKIVIDLKPDAPATLSAANSNLLMSATQGSVD